MGRKTGPAASKQSLGKRMGNIQSTPRLDDSVVTIVLAEAAVVVVVVDDKKDDGGTVANLRRRIFLPTGDRISNRIAPVPK